MLHFQGNCYLLSYKEEPFQIIKSVFETIRKEIFSQDALPLSFARKLPDIYTPKLCQVLTLEQSLSCRFFSSGGPPTTHLREMTPFLTVLILMGPGNNVCVLLHHISSCSQPQYLPNPDCPRNSHTQACTCAREHAHM